MDGKAKCSVFGLALAILAFGFCSAALYIAYWFRLETFYFGLFRYCIDAGPVEVCDMVSSDMTSHNFEIIRWFAAASGLILGIVIILGFLLVCLHNACLAITGCVFALISGVCMLVSVCLSVEEKDIMGFEFSTAYILGCVTTALAIFAAIAFGCSKPKKGVTSGRVVHPE